MSKRILIHSLVFSPDGVSTAYIYNDIALKLHEQGYNVIVLTTTPHFNKMPELVKTQPMRWKVWGICKESDFHGIKVLHVPQKKFKNTLLRMIGFVYWHFISFFIGLTIRHVDLILSPSPPLTIGYLNLWLARIKKCKTIYNVQEVYPDFLRMKEGIVLRMLKRIENKVYANSDAVTTIDNVFYDIIINRFVDKDKLHVIPNFVDTALYRQTDWESVLDSRLFFHTNAVKLLYAGNIGIAQSWTILISLAEKLREHDMEFFIIGEGVHKGQLEKEISRLNLTNVHLLPYQPRESMPAILSYSDISFIFMNPEMDSDGFPSKVYTIMACERPILVASGNNTPIVKFLEGKGCAKLVTEPDEMKRVEIMADWLSSVTKEELKQMGHSGLQVITAGYTREKVTGQYVNLVNQLIK